MAEKKTQIIIKKIKKGGHGAAHGGAWKVAYADFVTAMMCFFLVMWLMGADEATKASIANYFNNPTLAWRPELKDADTVPLGNRTGSGETVLKGADGETPEQLIKKPEPVVPADMKAKVDADGALTAEEIATAETMSFSFRESELFPQDASAQLAQPVTANLLAKIGKVARNFGGTMVIRGGYDEASSGNYELEMSRLVAVKNFVIEKRWLGEDLMTTSLRKRIRPDSDSPRRPASSSLGLGLGDDRKIEIVFMK